MDNHDTLATRARMPDSLRVLTKAFPRATWEAHANFAGLVAFWLDRHLMFRRLCETLRRDAEAAADGTLDPQQMQARVSRFGSMLVQQLHAHHQIEDTHYFPVLSRKEAALARGFDILDRDHHALDGLLADFTTSANGLLRGTRAPGVFRDDVARFETLLLRHLEDEEDLIVPVILKHGPDGLH